MTTRILLTIILIVLSAGRTASAEWVENGRSGDGITFYVDRTTIRYNGNIVTRWELWDYQIIQTVKGHSYLSAKVKREYDCTGKTTRTLGVTYMSGNMGAGTAVGRSSQENTWQPVEPGSFGEKRWVVACLK